MRSPLSANVSGAAQERRTLLVMKAERLSEEAPGAFLRTKGIHGTLPLHRPRFAGGRGTSFLTFLGGYFSGPVTVIVYSCPLVTL